MRYLALCCDYDGTIAHHGRVSERTLGALESLRASGRRLLLVTGRELDDLEKVFPHLQLFDRVVAENGALIFHPETRAERLLAERPPDAFVEALRAKQVAPISVGRIIVATWEPHENVVLETIREMGLELQVIFNKGAVMVLPATVNKATGLKAALAELHLSPHNAIGVGDAENDHAFLSICECAVAVSNALPALKERADIVTAGDHGEGVTELIEELLHDDLAAREAVLARHAIVLGTNSRGETVRLSPYRISALVVGTSGGGKSTVATALVERLESAGYNYCVIDPEGDYDSLEDAIVIGGPNHAPTLDECMQVIGKPGANAVINMLGIKFEDRPRFFVGLFARIQALRARAGRPHWTLIDEAHHVLPANWEAVDATLPAHMEGVLLISVAPRSVLSPVVRALDTLIALGDQPQQMLHEFAVTGGESPPQISTEALPAGTALLWRRGDAAPEFVRIEPGQTERRRHLRKYAEGELPPDRSFYFRGRRSQLNLRAHNLVLFLELADGVDDDTWLFHLRRGDYSTWLKAAVKDEELAQAVAQVEAQRDPDPRASRCRIREAIEAKYTLPAAPDQPDS